LALKTSQEKKDKTKVQVEEESSSDDDLDTNIALMVRKTTKMLKKLNRERQILPLIVFLYIVIKWT
jgi:hypothetical protein